MNKKEFFNQIESILNVEQNSLNGSEDLNDLNGWDSLAVLSFIVLADTEFSKILTTDAINDCDTVQDLYSAVSSD